MSQGWSKIFNRINWLNRPSTNTPLNAANLNAGDSAIDKLDDRIITLDTVKADMQVVNGMVSDVSLNESNGVITITYKNGSTKTYDTNLEKIATNFTYDYSTQRLVLTLSDGSKQYVDMSALITQYEFKDSTTIAFSVDKTGKISASVKNGSITEAMLETGYLANIKVEVAKAEAASSQAQSSETSSDYNAKLSRSYAIGGSGIREGEDTDNAMYYYEQAKKTDIGQIRSEVDELNSNLDNLGYGKNGVYNILDLSKLFNSNFDIEESNITNKITDTRTFFNFYVYLLDKDEKIIDRPINDIISSNESKDFTFSLTSGCEKIILKHNGSSRDINIGMINIIDIGLKENDIITVHISVSSNDPTVVGGIVINELAIVKGSTFTEYEPYIPSVKMLAEENAQQGTEAMDLKMLGWTVPSECPIQNYVDSDGVFHQRVGRVDLSNLNWVNESYAPSHFYAQFTSIKNFTEIEKANIFCAKYTAVSASDASNQSLNKVIVSSNQYIAVDDNSYSDATAFKNAMKGVYLYYELATPITMTIDGNEAVTQIKNDLGGLSFSVSGTTLTITDGTNTWSLSAN